MIRLKSKAALLVVLALIIVSTLSTIPSLRAQSSAPNFSTVYISPTTTCCRTLNTPYQQNENFSVSVDLNLLAGESFNAIDVRVNYTNPHYETAGGTVQGVLQAMSIDYSHSVFSSSQYTYQVLTDCIDGQAVGNAGSASGCSMDVVGQVHLSEVFIGNHTINGPLIGQLFTINFKVWGGPPGYSVFVPDRTEFVVPKALSFIPVLKEAGIFGSQGAVAFFNYLPDYQVDTLVSPSLLVNQPVYFNATDSFVANSSLIGFKSYTWNFGDGSPNATGPLQTHTYGLPGNYTVTLTVVDDRNEVGVLVRQVSVLLALGSLSLTVDDSSGTPQSANVRVSIFNSSSSTTPFSTKIINQVGGVTFNSLASGNYYLTFSAPGFVESSKTEKILPGFTLLDTVYLTPTPAPPDYTGLIYLGTILGAIGIAVGFMVYNKRRSSSHSGKRKTRPSNVSGTKIARHGSCHHR